jgi:hypothetical protein
MERKTAFLLGSFSKLIKLSGRWARLETEASGTAQVSRPAAALGFIGRKCLSAMPGETAQIFDNLVGCSKVELVRTLSKTGANTTGWGKP